MGLFGETGFSGLNKRFSEKRKCLLPFYYTDGAPPVT